MKGSLLDYVLLKFENFLLKEDKLPKKTYLYDYKEMLAKIKPADVLLIESHTRIGNIIRLVTESTWTHAAFYIGKLNDITDPKLRELLQQHVHDFSSDEQLLVETQLGEGTVVSALHKYKGEHIRVLRPRNLLPEDAQKVIGYTIYHIGKKYSLRHLFDLARFIFPWSIFPRRWRSSLFQHNTLQPTEDICSSMIARAFQSVNYPVLPVMQEGARGYELIHRNPRLYTPSDFDLSPFFDVIKYPIFSLKEGMSYRDLPWEKQMLSDDVAIVKIADSKPAGDAGS